MGLGFVGANMGQGFGWWRRGLAMVCVLDDGEYFTMGCVLNEEWVLCIIGF